MCCDVGPAALALTGEHDRREEHERPDGQARDGEAKGPALGIATAGVAVAHGHDETGRATDRQQGAERQQGKVHRASVPDGPAV